MPFVCFEKLFKRKHSKNPNSDALTMARKDSPDIKVLRITNRLKKIENISKLAVILLLVANIKFIECSQNSSSVNNDIAKRVKLLNAVTGRFFGNIYENGTFRTGNSLWDDILNKCTVNPSVSCLQKNFYSFLDDKLNYNGDVKFGNVCFEKNAVDINKYTKEANIIYLTGSKRNQVNEDRAFDEENEIKDDEEPESPLEEVTDSLYDKGLKFLVTHDMKMRLPEFLFDGAILKISPRALTKTGALVHIDLEPREQKEEGRLFFHKIKKMLKRKLVTAAIGIILVVKLIALKLVFVLPIIFGVTTAKKMFLKFLLFLFPALSHIFKLCSWYHNNYHTTKYHHHHHLITHHHKPSHHGYTYPASSSVVVKPHAAGPPSTSDFYPQEWELSGPGLGSEYIASDIHRNAIASFKPHVNDMNDINSWGLGMPPGPSMNVGEYAAGNNVVPTVVSPSGQRVTSHLGGRPVGPPNPYYRHKKQPKDPVDAEKEALIRAASLAARAPPSPVRDEILRVSAAKLTETNRVKTEAELVKHQQQILAATDPETQSAEKFYGNLLERVDKILLTLGANDPGCKDRAVCALYRDPFSHAPYSNLVSNELSKDSSELLPPADSKMALRYYKYVQAARDGQEQKDCVILYPHCNIDYNKK
ncbi:uncharacterized protein LOC106130651 [Amyelois transitella]|uniref:uncharacterized protein LOC106130651 n=1 Tax=Amyelois transitella TaxID=680683 RepID=UPI00298FE67B|nr:uncharacterized protein LOC106130651 [Amyelois transitella]XP_060807087.1 uncharacterized protein LOC106130651 [Amyelois transitella]